MRYLLVVGFSCDVFKQEPQARIFVADQLIDEFKISKHNDTLNTAKKKFFQNKHILQPFLMSEIKNILIKNFPPLRFYSVEIGNTLDGTELSIEIENRGSNQTNGFMTKSTLIKLQVCFFFPLDQKLLSRLQEIKKKNRILQNYAWYRGDENIIFDLMTNGLCWQGKNGQMIKPNRYGLANYKIGGDGVFKCELVKKYQILINKTKKPYRHTFDNIILDYLLNKYIGYANQRNRN